MKKNELLSIVDQNTREISFIKGVLSKTEEKKEADDFSYSVDEIYTQLNRVKEWIEHFDRRVSLIEANILSQLEKKKKEPKKEEKAHLEIEKTKRKRKKSPKKRCSRCGKEKRLSSFYHNKSTADGYSYWCKLCHSKSNAKRRARKKKEKDPDVYVSDGRYPLKPHLAVDRKSL